MSLVSLDKSKEVIQGLLTAKQCVSGLTAHQHKGYMKAGPRFRVSFKRSEKRDLTGFESYQFLRVFLHAFKLSTAGLVV